jgi:hypothetical protein
MYIRIIFQIELGVLQIEKDFLKLKMELARYAQVYLGYA